LLENDSAPEQLSEPSHEPRVSHAVDEHRLLEIRTLRVIDNENVDPAPPELSGNLRRDAGFAGAVENLDLKRRRFFARRFRPRPEPPDGERKRDEARDAGDRESRPRSFLALANHLHHTLPVPPVRPPCPRRYLKYGASFR
jgi:hypothetical protein